VAFTLVAVLLPLCSTGCRGKKIDYSVSGLILALKDKDPDVRCTAATNLGKYGAEAREAVPALTEALADQDKHVRVAAAYSLGRIGPAATDAVPALREAVKDKDQRLQQAATHALQQILDPKPKSQQTASTKRTRHRNRTTQKAGVSRPLGGGN
jgi:hypothetical protein